LVGRAAQNDSGSEIAAPTVPSTAICSVSSIGATVRGKNDQWA
jgi:hypothetical protein